MARGDGGDDEFSGVNGGGETNGVRDEHGRGVGMGNVWLKIRVWTKIVLFALLFLYVIVFVANNSAKAVQPWVWFGKEPHTTLLLLVLYVFLAGVVVTFMVGTTFRTVKQFREIRQRARSERLERDVTDMKTKAAMLRSKPEGDPSDAPVDVPE